MNVDQLIDRFVEAVNSREREPGFEDEIPPSLRIAEPTGGQYKLFDWNIKPYEHIDWIDALTSRLPRRLPPSYLSLITRYIFPYFEVKPILFLANTPEGIFHLHELRIGIFAGKGERMPSVLFNNGFIQFARTYTGLYDPICFDARRKSKDNEYPIVEIYHEDAIMHSKITILKHIAPSFIDFVREYIGKQSV